MADRIMDQISKLLMLSANEGATQAERDRAMERAVYKSQAHSIDLEVAKRHAIKKTEVQKPERRSHQIGEYRNAKTGRSQESVLSHYVDLFLEVAHVYDLRCTIGGGNTAVHAVGFPADHELAERIYSLLVVQMIQEADAALARGDNKTKSLQPVRKRVEIPEDERAWGQSDGHGGWYDDEDGTPSWRAERRYNRWIYGGYDVKPHDPPTHRYEEVRNPDGSIAMEEKVTSSDARTWRRDYYRGFVSKIGRKLREEKKRAYHDAGVDLDDDSNEKGVAIVDKKDQIDKAHEEEVQRYVLETGHELGTYEGSGHTRDWSAHEKGQKAGERAVTGNERVVS